MTPQELLGSFQALDKGARQRVGIALAAILVVVTALCVANGGISDLEKKKAAREADLVEMMRLKLRYQQANMGAQRLTNRLLATRPDDSPAKIVEEIGIKGRSSQIKPVKGDALPGYVEDAADVRIEGVNANEATNLLYRLEKGARPVTVKKAFIKQRFDDPSRLDLSLTIALIKPAPAGPQ